MGTCPHPEALGWKGPKLHHSCPLLSLHAGIFAVPVFVICAMFCLLKQAEDFNVNVAVFTLWHGQFCGCWVVPQTAHGRWCPWAQTLRSPSPQEHSTHPSSSCSDVGPFQTHVLQGWVKDGSTDGVCNYHPLQPLQPSQPQTLPSCSLKKKVMPFPSGAQFSGSPAVAMLPLSVLQWGFAAPHMQGHCGFPGDEKGDTETTITFCWVQKKTLFSVPVTALPCNTNPSPVWGMEGSSITKMMCVLAC